jgi:TetR/AcrR family transcriptional repressor of nem operon
MRFPKDHKARTRERILDAAATVFRRDGFAGAGVDAVMREAGLTAGGFYAHFPSKDALFAEAVVHALRKSTIYTGPHLEGLSGADWVMAAVGRYLSPQHRDRTESGCPLPPLLSEVARGTPEAKAGFEGELKQAAGLIGGHMAEPGDDAFAVLALMVGGMVLARGVAAPALSDRILAACRGAAAEVAKPKSSPRKPRKKESK